jgi:hypothetical protein
MFSTVARAWAPAVDVIKKAARCVRRSNRSSEEE